LERGNPDDTLNNALKIESMKVPINLWDGVVFQCKSWKKNTASIIHCSIPSYHAF